MEIEVKNPMRRWYLDVHMVFLSNAMQSGVRKRRNIRLKGTSIF